MELPIRTPVPMTEPIKPQKQEWVQSPEVRVMGIDPGLGSTGVVVLSQNYQDRPGIQHARVITTEKAKKKERTGLRVSADDKHRYTTIWTELTEVLTQYKPHAIGVEVYAPYGKQGGSAWKCAVVYGMIHGFALANGLVLFPFNAGDLKKGITGKMGASKEDVEQAMLPKVAFLESVLAKFPKSKHEHVADAAGHALLGLRELHEIRRMMGIQL